MRINSGVLPLNHKIKIFASNCHLVRPHVTHTERDIERDNPSRCGGAMLCDRCTAVSLYSACYLHWIKLAAWSYRLGYLLRTIDSDGKEINDGDVCFIYHFIILRYLLDSLCPFCVYVFILKLLPHQVRSSDISRHFVYRLQPVAKHNVLFSIGRMPRI